MIPIIGCAVAVLFLFVMTTNLIKLRKSDAALRGSEEQLKREIELGRLRLQARNFDQRTRMRAVASWLAHELRQPLSAILSNAGAALQFLKQENPNLDEIGEILKDIIADENRASAVISRMRDTLQRGETSRERISLAAEIRENLALFRDEMAEQGVECISHLETNLEVNADRVQIREVLLNLVMNSLEAMQNRPAHQRRLEVTLTAGRPGMAQITLHDSGPGVPDSQSARLFDPFQTNKKERMGIGLFICRSTIQAHGGSIWFENSPGGGATFSFTLPLKITADVAMQQSEAEIDAHSARREAGEELPRALRMLLIDDSEPYRRITWSLLKGIPHVELTGEAADGVEAVRKAGDLKPDVVLLDISLSGINGIDAASQIRIVSPHTKIIFLSQYDDPDVIRGVLHTGALGYVLKVDAAKELVDAVNAALVGERYLSSGLRDGAG